VALGLARQEVVNLTKGTSVEELGYQLEDLAQSSSPFLTQPAKVKRVEFVLSDACLSNVHVLKPSMSLRICVGFVVGVLRWEEGWMWEFRSKRKSPSHGFIGSPLLNLRRQLLRSPLSKDPKTVLFSHAHRTNRSGIPQHRFSL
jgi:hypothetical protein